MQATPPTFLETKLYLQKKEKKNKNTKEGAEVWARKKTEEQRGHGQKRDEDARTRRGVGAALQKDSAQRLSPSKRANKRERPPAKARFPGTPTIVAAGHWALLSPNRLSPSTCAHPLFAPVSGQNQFAFCLVRDPVGSCDLFFFWGRGRGKREGLGSVCADKAAHFCCHQTIAKRKIIKRKICLVLDAHASLVVFSPISKGKKGMVKRKRLCRGGACTRVGGRRRMPKGDKKNCGGPICTLSEITHRHTNSDRRLDPFTVYPNRSRHRRFSSFFI
ncbi:hypothetical protein TW95_gp1465 [Pandoravirus inopinatum]|uniref:Uncharacterized protein n=1 Tax=Pandoravirus inopinatum TaxID=1605721 RepID=A0A0B5J3Q0_9VIRU|nr:hypothetical protein TW95_gp1465 [Pandoravirus inopinatum]AJF98199.1 hypothetical protein [Pandoravirus inopinatum]